MESDYSKQLFYLKCPNIAVPTVIKKIWIRKRQTDGHRDTETKREREAETDRETKNKNRLSKYEVVI